MPKVRTTIHPNTPITVDEREYLDLQRQGLLLEDEPTSNRTATVSGDNK
jgi:hypothetical protein